MKWIMMLLIPHNDYPPLISVYWNSVLSASKQIELTRVTDGPLEFEEQPIIWRDMEKNPPKVSS